MMKWGSTFAITAVLIYLNTLTWVGIAPAGKSALLIFFMGCSFMDYTSNPGVSFLNHCSNSLNTIEGCSGWINIIRV